MQEIEVDTITLAADIETLQQNLNFIVKSVESSYGAVKALDTMWDGPANEMFNLQFTKDSKEMQELCKNIQEIINGLIYAKEQYNSCENSISGIIGSIDV